MGIVFQRHKINNRSTLTWSRDNWRLLSARLLWEFSTSRVASEVSHACCCGVCPFRALSLPLSLALSLSLSLLTHPLSLRLPRAAPPVCFCCLGGLLDCGRGRISRVLEFRWEFVEDGACCDRVSLDFGAARWGSGVGGERKLFLRNGEMLSHVLRPVFLPTDWVGGDSFFVWVCFHGCFCLTLFGRSRLLLLPRCSVS